MWSSEDFRRAESAIFAGALLGLLLVLLGVGRGADLALLDRMQLYEEPEPARVAILDLDDRTLRAYGWPVDPGLYAAVFELLTASGAKGVGVDLEFAPAGVSLGPAAEVGPMRASIDVLYHLGKERTCSSKTAPRPEVPTARFPTGLPSVAPAANRAAATSPHHMFQLKLEHVAHCFPLAEILSLVPLAWEGRLCGLDLAADQTGDNVS